MAQRIIYKGDEHKLCSYTQAQNLVANEGWSWTQQPTTKLKAVKKSAKPKKVKVKAEADVIPFNDGNPINQDFDIENTEE
tara:strand:+ start:196 stop:435 length:240 start_codon:yes stop_codon:yes gene_type:complete